MPTQEEKQITVMTEGAGEATRDRSRRGALPDKQATAQKQ
jgi:hypothetical protein